MNYFKNINYSIVLHSALPDVPIYWFSPISIISIRLPDDAPETRLEQLFTIDFNHHNFFPVHIAFAATTENWKHAQKIARSTDGG